MMCGKVRRLIRAYSEAYGNDIMLVKIVPRTGENTMLPEYSVFLNRVMGGGALCTATTHQILIRDAANKECSVSIITKLLN